MRQAPQSFLHLLLPLRRERVERTGKILLFMVPSASIHLKKRLPSAIKLVEAPEAVRAGHDLSPSSELARKREPCT